MEEKLSRGVNELDIRQPVKVQLLQLLNTLNERMRNDADVILVLFGVN